MYWAIDRSMIAPRSDLKWHVSKQLDRRNRDFQELIDLDKKPVILPRDKKFYPRMDVLEWGMERLIMCAGCNSQDIL